MALPKPRSRVIGRWYSSPFDELASILPSTAVLNHKGKQRRRWWRHWAGHTSFGLSAGSWVRLNVRGGMRVRTPAKCSISWHGHVEKELLHVPKPLGEGADGRKGRKALRRNDCGRIVEGSHRALQAIATI